MSGRADPAGVSSFRRLADRLRARPASTASPLTLVAAFTAGALALLQLPALPSPLTAVPLLLAALAMPRLQAPLLAFVLGAALTGREAASILDSRWPASRFGETRIVTGTIASLPQAQPDEAADGEAAAPAATRTWRFLFEPVTPADGIPARIRVAWYRSAETLRGGACWRLTLVLRTPHGSANPGAFDYEGWLFRQGIGATATVRAGEPCTAAEPPPPRRPLLAARQAFADRLAAWLPGHPALPMVAALTLGDTSGLDDEDWQAFRLTGTTHLVAISGFNVAIVAGVVFWLVRWLWRQVPGLCLRLPAPRAALFASVLAAIAYALLAGFEPPVQRAALMLALLALAGGFGGIGDPPRALALAWGLIVALDPLTLLSPGLWLSFAAVGAIFYATAGRLGPLPGWRAALQVQLGLSVLLAPLTLYGFQGTSLTGPLVNLLAVPVAAVLTPALLAALLLSVVVPAAGLPLLGWTADALAQSHAALLWIAGKTPDAWAAASPEPAALLLALLGALALLAPAGLPLRGFGVIALCGVLLPPPRAVEQGFRLTVLDVGQGLAVLLQTRDHALLYDAGPAWPGGFDAGRSVVVPVLLRAGVRRLDRLVVSHGDRDHIGGVAAVAAVVPVVARLGSGADAPCRAGERWDWDGVAFELLGGPAPELSDNDGSCVLRVSHAGRAVLLAGDIEAEGEARLLRQAAPRLAAEVLVTPHHGSRTSSSAAFIEAVAPRLTIHSAGWHHRYGHPAPEVVARYAERGVRQIATGDSGAVGIGFDGGGLQTVTERERRPRLWSTRPDEVWRRRAPSGR